MVSTGQGSERSPQKGSPRTGPGGGRGAPPPAPDSWQLAGPVPAGEEGASVHEGEDEKSSCRNVRQHFLNVDLDCITCHVTTQLHDFTCNSHTTLTTLLLN